MDKYFYKLEYIIFHYLDKKDNENVEEIFRLGYYSSKKKAEQMLDKLKNKPGFKEYGIDNFKITKHRVTLTKDLNKEGVKRLYILSYEYVSVDENQEEFNYVYYFSPKYSRNEINKLKNQLSKKRKYQHKEGRRYYDFAKDGFCVDIVNVNECASLFSKGFDPELTEFEMQLMTKADN